MGFEDAQSLCNRGLPTIEGNLRTKTNEQKEKHTPSDIEATATRSGCLCDVHVGKVTPQAACRGACGLAKARHMHLWVIIFQLTGGGA